MMKRFYISAALCFVFLVRGVGQTSPYDPLPKILPPTPDAAAMQKYGETEINLFKGEPNINIPIYTISAKRISIPIALNYNAGGFRVGELSTNVGLGWNIAAGGMISRNIRGQSDFKTPGRKHIDINTFNPNLGITFDTADYEKAKEVLTHNLDVEPDIFNYSLPTRSGKFVLNDSLTKAYTIPFEKLKIDILGFINGTSSNDDTGFVITDESGIKYFFTVRETNNPSEECSLGVTNNREVGGANITGWYLSKIVDPLKDSIVFEYEQYSYAYREGQSEVRYRYLPSSQCASYSGEFSNQERVCTRRVLIYTNRIKRIITSNGEVEFFYNTIREDIDYYATNSDAKRLDSIIVRNSADVLRKFFFNYDYFVSHGKSTAAVTDTFLYKRLKLTGFREQGALGTQAKEYRLGYYETQLLPHRLHKGQDFLGFYNGRANPGSGLIPCGYGISNCANRDVDSLGTYQQANVLKEIIYPTGGKTKFFFEPHQRTYFATTYDTTFDAFSLEAQPGTISNDSVLLSASQSSYLRISWSLPASSDPLEGISRGFVAFPNGSKLQLDSIGASGSLLVSRIEGEYKLRISSHQQYVSDASIVMTWVDTVVSSTHKVHEVHSGLRVRKVVDSAGFGNPEVTRFYKYENPGDSLEQFVDFRVYSFKETVAIRRCFEAMVRVCSFERFSSQTVSPFGVENDNTFGYKYVTILFDSTSRNKGKEEYVFSTLHSEIDSLGQYSDLLHIGKLLIRKQFRYDNLTQTYSPVQEEKHRYTFLVDEDDFIGTNTPPRYGHLNESFITGAKIQYRFPEDPNFCMYSIAAEFITDGYTRNSFWQYPNRRETIQYAVGGGLLKSTETFKYDNPAHIQLTTNEVVTSQRDTIRTVVKYVSDYVLPASGDVIITGMKSLQMNHLLANPIEKLTIIKKQSGEEYILSGTITSFKANMPVPDKIFMIETAAPIQKSNFTFSSISSSGAFTMDARYKEQAIFQQYDVTGNILEQRRIGDKTHSYLWDHNFEYPVAECIGAENTQIAYTSFEADSKGNWSFTGSAATETGAPTGKKVYNLGQLSGNIVTTKALASDRQYTVTYWIKTGSGAVTVNGITGASKASRNGWTLQEVSLASGTTAVTVTGNGLIDELRLHPSNAQMKTFTYDPLVGITAECTPNNRITYYEYDLLKRLSVIRDQDRNILKTIDYKYQQQQ